MSHTVKNILQFFIVYHKYYRRMVQLPYYVYAIAASLIVGVHLFTMKMVSFSQNVSEKQMYIAVTTISLLLSRWCIYKAMEATSNPTLVHVILNLSIFVTFFASILFLKLSQFHFYKFLFGLFLVVVGLACIQNSYTVKS